MRGIRFPSWRMSLRAKALVLLTVVFVAVLSVWLLVIDTLVDRFFQQQRISKWEADQRQFARVVQRQREAMELLALLASMDPVPFKDEQRWLALMTDYQVLWMGRFDAGGKAQGDLSLWGDDIAEQVRPAVRALLHQASMGRLECVDERCYRLLRFDERCDSGRCVVILVQDVTTLLSEFYLLSGRNIVLVPQRRDLPPLGTHLERYEEVVGYLRAPGIEDGTAIIPGAGGDTYLVTRLSPPPDWGPVGIYALHDITSTLALFNNTRDHAGLIGLLMWLLAALVLVLATSRLLEQIRHLSDALAALAGQAYERARRFLDHTPPSLVPDEMDALVDSSRHVVDELQRLHGELVQLAEFDPLTHLKNRRAFQKALEQWVKDRTRGTLILVDLNRFKHINDLYGHLAGDETLQEVALRMDRFARRHPGVVLFRLGGDEFMIWVPDQWVDERLLQELTREIDGWFVLSTGEQVYIESSVGAVHLPFEGASAQEVIMRVDSAMYRAKNGESELRWRLYDAREDNQGERLREEHALISWLRQSLENDAFYLVFQPIVRVQDLSVSHHEVLLRLDGPDGSPISPGRFIPLAERYGLSGRIDEWVVDQVLRRLSQLPDSVVLAVNLSAATVQRRDLADFLKGRLAHYGVGPCRLIVEMTETAYVTNMAQARESLEALREHGIRVALDDFGEGYASFNYLTELPFDFVKIDGRYVRHLHEQDNYQALISGLTQIIHAWNSQVVAEFVDNDAVLARLQAVGVDFAQGYLLGEPSDALVVPTQGPACSASAATRREGA